MKLLICLLFYSLIAGASETPETTIQVSILDLLPKRIEPLRLPKDYGNQVARAIQQSKPQLLSCIDGASNTESSLLAKIRIRGNGTVAKIEGNLLPENRKVQACVTSQLSLIHYPKHPLPGDVEVSLPIRMEKEML